MRRFSFVLVPQLTGAYDAVQHAIQIENLDTVVVNNDADRFLLVPGEPDNKPKINIETLHKRKKHKSIKMQSNSDHSGIFFLQENDENTNIFQKNNRIAPASSTPAMVRNPCSLFKRDRHISNMENRAEILIGVVTNRKMMTTDESLHYPFMVEQMSRLTDAKNSIVLAYFTNSKNATKLPTFIDNDNVSSYSTAQNRYLNTIRYMSNCWQGNKLKWFYLMDDDTALSPVRLLAFLEMVENRYGSPYDNAYLLGRRATWSRYRAGVGYDTFGGNGMAFSSGMVRLLHDEVSNSVWHEFVEGWNETNRPWYENRLFSMIASQNLESKIYRGPWLHRPFGLGLTVCNQGGSDEMDHLLIESREDSAFNYLSKTLGTDNVRLTFSLHKVKSNVSFRIARQIFSDKSFLDVTSQDYAMMNCDIANCSDCKGFSDSESLASCSADYVVDCKQHNFEYGMSFKEGKVMNILAIVLLTGSIFLQYMRLRQPLFWIIAFAYILGWISLMSVKYYQRMHPAFTMGRNLAPMWCPLLALCSATAIAQYMRDSFVTEPNIYFRYGHYAVIAVCVLFFYAVSSVVPLWEKVLNYAWLALEVIGFVYLVHLSDRQVETVEESPRSVPDEMTCYSEPTIARQQAKGGRVKRFFNKILPNRSRD